MGIFYLSCFFQVYFCYCLVNKNRVIEVEIQLPNIGVCFHYVPFQKVRKIKMRDTLKLELVNILACHVMSFFPFREHSIMIRKLYCFCLQNVRRLGGKSHNPSLCLHLFIFKIRIISPLPQNNVKIMQKMLVESI